MAQSPRLFQSVFAFIGGQHPFSLQPNLDLAQLVTLALLGHPDRIANVEEMTLRLLQWFPWFRDRRVMIMGRIWPTATLDEHIRRFLQELNRRFDNVFRQVDSASRGRSPCNTQGHVEELHYLPSNAENDPFRVTSANPQAGTSPSSPPSFRFFDLLETSKT